MKKVFFVFLFFLISINLYSQDITKISFEEYKLDSRITSVLNEIKSDSNNLQTIDFKPDFFIIPSISIYGGYPEYFSFDLGGDFLFPSIMGFPYSYGFYALGGFGTGSDINNIRVSTGLSAQHDYVGLKLGIGGDFSFLSSETHEPYFFTEAILRLWIFEFKGIYDWNTDLPYNQNMKFYCGVNLIMCLANIFMTGM